MHCQPIAKLERSGLPSDLKRNGIPGARFCMCLGGFFFFLVCFFFDVESVRSSLWLTFLHGQVVSLNDSRHPAWIAYSGLVTHYAVGFRCGSLFNSPGVTVTIFR